MFIMEEEKKNKTKADIRIIGVGGGGNNALETMIKDGIKGVQFIAINTDDQVLQESSANIKVQLGSKLTKGLGAGANPEVGRRAAVESYEEIVNVLKGSDMVFVTAGMGGGTGTGGAPLVAQAANELGALTVGIVTKPFIFEGHKRMKQAEEGIRELRKYVDTLIVIPNEKLFEISDQNTPLLETFKITDNVLLQAVKGIAELVSVPGLINLDFADIKTVMMNKGMALMGRGIAEGEDRAKKAIYSAVSSPLLDGISIKGATGMIVNITANSSLSLREIHSASSVMTKLADDSADIIVGTVIDKSMNKKLSVTVIATGFRNQGPQESYKKLFDNDSKELFFEKESSDPEGEKSAVQGKEEDIPSPQNESLEEELEKPIISDEENNSSDEKNSQQDCKENLADEKNSQNLKKSKSKLSPKEILLSKAKEYAENQKSSQEDIDPDNQMSMDWKESQLEDNLSSPFESSIDFTDEDMV